MGKNSSNYDYMVLIKCFTFNHEKYIKDALEGFVMQKTNFPYIAVVVDDASTDKTAEIIREYEKKYPDIIKPYYLKENHYSQRKSKSPYFKDITARSKYIALCEGDDYWTDSLKLQKQFDFMEENEDYNICFTYSKTFFMNTGKMDEVHLLKEKEYTHYDILAGKRSDTHTATILFRKEILKNNILEQRYSKAPAGDIFLKLLGTYRSKAVVLPFQTAVYRKHNFGVWSSLSGFSRIKWKIRMTFYLLIYSFKHEKRAIWPILKRFIKFFVKRGINLKNYKEIE